MLRTENILQTLVFPLLYLLSHQLFSPSTLFSLCLGALFTASFCTSFIVLYVFRRVHLLRDDFFDPSSVKGLGLVFFNFIFGSTV